MARYAVVTATEVLEAQSLPSNTSVQKAEIIALKQALNLAVGKRVNIWTDPRYAFVVIHAHGAIWKERGLLSAQGSSIQHQEEIFQLLKLKNQRRWQSCTTKHINLDKLMLQWETEWQTKQLEE